MPPRRHVAASSPLEKFFTEQSVSAHDSITGRMYQGFDNVELNKMVQKMDPNMTFGDLLHEFLGKPDATELRKIADNMIAAKKSLPPEIDFKYPMQRQKLWEKLTEMTQSSARVSKPQDYVRFIQLAVHLTQAGTLTPAPPVL